MVDKDELEWLHMNAQESQQAAYIKNMKDAQQLEAHKNKCLAFVTELKHLRRLHPNHMEFGSEYNKLYNKYFGEVAQNNNKL